MFNKRKQPPIRTLIAHGSRIDGNMTFQDGLRIDGAQLAELVTALERLLGDPALRQRLAAQALARARKEFSWSSVAKRTMKLLPESVTRS